MTSKHIFTATPARVCVGTRAKYDSRNFEGHWVELEGHDKESFEAVCHDLHSDEPDPELMFLDYEGFPAQWFRESQLGGGLWEWLESSEDDQEMFLNYVAALSDANDHEEEGTAMLQDARDRFAGTNESFAAFAQDYAEKAGAVSADLPEWFVIDWDASWNGSLRFEYDTHTDPDGLIWFFRRN